MRRRAPPPVYVPRDAEDAQVSRCARLRVGAHDGPMFNSYEMTKAFVAERQETLRHEARQHRLAERLPAGPWRHHIDRDRAAGDVGRPDAAGHPVRLEPAGRLNRTIQACSWDAQGSRRSWSAATAELGRLRALLGASPVPAVALIAGEAGIGKTRLVQELVASAPAGTLVLAGQADPGTVGRPMELFLDALGKTDVSGQPRVRRGREGPEPDRPRSGCGPASTSSDPSSAGGPALVVFEDLHWADAESLATFELLAEPDGGPLVLVGTYRPDGLSRRHPAADLLPRLDRRHSVTHVQLGRLGPAEVSDVPRRGVRAGSVVPGRRRPPHPHRRQPVLPRGARRQRRRPRQRRTWRARPCRGPSPRPCGARSTASTPRCGASSSAASVLGRRVPFDLLAAVTAERRGRR